MIQNDIIRLIVIEESANDAEVILNRLRKARYPIRPTYVEDDEDLEKALDEQHEWDLIISIPQVNDFTIIQVCEMVTASKQDIPIIVVAKKLNCKLITTLFNAGVRQVVPGDECLPVVVGKELENLAERRKRKRLEQLYKESQKYNKMLLETSRDAIAYVQDGMHVHANPSYFNMFNYESMDDLEGLPIMDLVTKTDRNQFKDSMRDITQKKLEECQIKLNGLKSDKKPFKLKMELSQALYDNEPCIQIIIRDEPKNPDIERLQRCDPITGLFNRLYFIELLEKALAKATKTSIRSVLFYIALDNFSTIEKNVGVGGTDPVLKNIGKVIKKHSEGCELARFASYAFTLLMPDKDGKKYDAEAGEFATQICKAVEANVTELRHETVVTTCSIGIAQVLSSAADPQYVLTDAHTACELAMKQGGNRFEKAVVKSGDDKKIKPSDIAKLIETAIEENRLSLRFQPIVNLHGETQEIYEVFLRMVDQGGENVPPGALFDAAEQANLTTTLDKWVLEKAVQALVAQEKKGHQTHFFIKLSDQAIKDESILLYVKKLLRNAKLPGKRLILEMSESIAISQVKLAKTFITQLKTFGCKSALEHFGTGLNSETTLKHIPVDYVKIDRSFSKDLSSNTENQQAVQEIIKMAREFGKLTIAEAVEDANSLTILWSSEVNFAQGHYIQEPLEDLNEFDFSGEEE
jgi:diguanylate cyclase (GGDEF)-like protein/PAS domain S-box-containing protein